MEHSTERSLREVAEERADVWLWVIMLTQSCA